MPGKNMNDVLASSRFEDLPIPLLVRPQIMIQGKEYDLRQILILSGEGSNPSSPTKENQVLTATFIGGWSCCCPTFVPLGWNPGPQVWATRPNLDWSGGLGADLMSTSSEVRTTWGVRRRSA